MRRSSSALTLLALILACAAYVPGSASAQSVWRRIRDQTNTKVKQRRERMDSTLVNAAGTAVDSTVEKAGRQVDTVVGTVGGVLDTALNAAERGVSSVLERNGSADDSLAARLASGRAVLPDIGFTANTDSLAPSADKAIKRLAKALGTTSAAFLIEGHTDAGADVASDQALSERRATAVKARLIAEGVPAGRLFAVGYGATRPLAASTTSGGTHSNARIEVARMQ